MPARPSILRPAKQLAAPFLFCLCLCLPAFAQQAPASTTNLMTETRAPLPDSPRPQPTGTLTLGERFHLEAHTSLGVPAFIIPAGGALLNMAHPPDNYPREWRDGGGAFGRLYGAEFARHTTGGFTHFAVAAIDREDPRYYPSTGGNFARRTAHALLFTVVDRNTAGHRTLAISNLAGSMAAGSVGMAFYPDGFNDFTHAYQHASIELTSFATHNLIAEFSPEIVRALHKMHVSDRIANAFLPEKSVGTAQHP
jgi:hypothetical protein